MILSFNEIEAIALKSARGAGVSWGLAEEAAYAARWLAERGLDWAGLLLARCEAKVSEAVRIEDGIMEGEALCPLRVGAFLADAGVGAARLEIRNVAVPTLLLPFLARVTPAQPLEVRLGPNAVAWLDGGQLHMSESGRALTPLGAVVIVSGSHPADGEPVPLLSRPLPVSTRLSQALAAFERRTYVPATHQSRLAGAGAGLSDND